MKSHTSISVRSESGGFTLLEVLVASVVLAIVMAILLGTLTSSMSLWRTTEGKLSTDREGRSSELLLAEDLGRAVMPGNPRLWPRTNNGYLQFLTLKPLDYQDDPASDFGDVCFVEYFVDSTNNALKRSFWGSRETYDNIIQAGQFPSPGADKNREQLLATNLMANNRDAVRLQTLGGYADTNHFVILATNIPPDPHLLPIQGTYNPSNFPVAVQVDLSFADPDAILNKDLWDKPNYVIRNAGIYSFRVSLPRPPAGP